jgi:hypothetical protein
MKRKILHLFFSILLIFLVACNFGNNGDGTGKNNNVVISDSLVSLTLDPDNKVSYYDNSRDDFCGHQDPKCKLRLTFNHSLFANLIAQKVKQIKVKLTPVTNKVEQQKVIEFSKDTPTEFNIEKFDLSKRDYQDIYFTIPTNPDLGANVKFKVEVTAAGVTMLQKYSNVSLTVADKYITGITFDADKVYNKGERGSVTFTMHDNNTDDKFDLQAANTRFANTGDFRSGLSNISGSCNIDMNGSNDKSCTIKNAFAIANYADDKIDGKTVNFRIYAIDPSPYSDNNDYNSAELSGKFSVPVHNNPEPAIPHLKIDPLYSEITKAHSVTINVSFTDDSVELKDPVTVHLLPNKVFWKKLKNKLKLRDSSDINEYIDINPQTIDLNSKADKASFVISIKPEITDEDMRTIFENFEIYANTTDSSAGKATMSEIANIKNGTYVGPKWLKMQDKNGNVVSSMSFVNGEDAQVFQLKGYKIDDIESVDLYVAKNGSIEPLDDGFDTEIVADKTSCTITFTIKADGAIPTDDKQKDTLIALIGEQVIPINSGVVDVTVTDPIFAYHISPEIRPVLVDFPEPYYIEIDHDKAASHGNTAHTNTDKTLTLYADKPDSDGCKNMTIHYVKVPTSGDPVLGNVCSLGSASHQTNDVCSCKLKGDANVDGYCVFKVEPGDPYKTANQSCNITLKVNGTNVSGSHEIISTNGFAVITVSANPDSVPFPNAHRIDMCSTETGNYNNCPLNADNWVTKFNRTSLDDKSLFNKAALFSISPAFFEAGAEDDNKFIMKNYPGRNIGGVAGFEQDTITLRKTNFIMGWYDKSPRWDNNRCLTGDFETSNLGCDNRSDSAFSVKGKAYVENGSIIVSKDGVSIDPALNNLAIPSRWETMGEAYGLNARYHTVDSLGGSSVMFNLHP